MADKQLRFFDMFCGGGGSARGAVMAGAHPVGALDMSDTATSAYALNFPTATTYTTLAGESNPKAIAEAVGPIQLLLASPECTSHSVAKGNKPRSEKSRATAFEVARFAKAMKPRWIVVENVIQMRRWARFDEWVAGIESLGYHTAQVVIDAQFHGTPQSRRRLLIVCDLEREPIVPVPGKRTKRTVRSILGTGESADKPWQYTPLRTENRSAATLERAEGAIAELGDDEEFILVYYGTDGAGGFQEMDRPLRTITTLDRFAHVRPTGNGHEMRMLQPPELAAAMGFPSTHRWPDVGRRERIRLIGNAVCPPVMKAVITALTQVNSRTKVGPFGS